MRGPVAKVRPEPVQRSVARRDVTGKVLGQVDLPPLVFGIEPNLAVLHQVVTAQLAAARSGTQSTKTRAEKRGGGAKPFAQKGTGRARQGSTRSPSWVGGGVALGPKPRSYRQHTPKKMVRLALHSALSDRASEERVALVDGWGWDMPRTKDAVAALQALGLDGRILVVLADEEVVAARSFANLTNVQITARSELCAYDILRNDWVLFSDRTLPGGESDLLIEEVVLFDEDPETGAEVIEIIEDIVNTETGEETIIVAEAVVTKDADGNDVIDVVEDIVDANTGEEVIVVAEISADEEADNAEEEPG